MKDPNAFYLSDCPNVMSIARGYTTIRLFWLLSYLGFIYEYDYDNQRIKFVGHYSLYELDEERSFVGHFDDLVKKNDSHQHIYNRCKYEYRIINNDEIEIFAIEDAGGDECEIDDISELVTRLHPNQPKGYGLEIRIG